MKYGSVLQYTYNEYCFMIFLSHHKKQVDDIMARVADKVEQIHKKHIDITKDHQEKRRKKAQRDVLKKIINI